MRHGPRAGGPRALGALTLAAGTALLPAAAPVGEISLSVSGLRSAKGVVRACMTPDPARFPRCTGDAESYRLVVPASGTAVRMTFRGVAAGRYAIAVLHDENGNGKADRAISMIPKEGFGFSRDAPVRMGPPRFSEAAITVGPGESRQAIHMRYML